MAGTIFLTLEKRTPEMVVSMESGLDGRNNNFPYSSEHEAPPSQWSPA